MSNKNIYQSNIIDENKLVTTGISLTMHLRAQNNEVRQTFVDEIVIE